MYLAFSEGYPALSRAAFGTSATLHNIHGVTCDTRVRRVPGRENSSAPIARQKASGVDEEFVGAGLAQLAAEFANSGFQFPEETH